ncbi:MAG: efflux RND transporter periplasmic adaptor subunit [Bacteroidia bacterium]|nr:efflux RND transporter periplasmic adaptor subunit [Bacteroidia bacterium]
MKKHIKLNMLIAALIVIALGSCSSEKEPGEKTNSEVKPSSDSLVTSITITAAQFRNAGIKLGYLGDKQLSETIKTSGSVDVPPQNYAQVSTYLGGVVKSILVQEGDFVKKGQMVITLEHPDFIKLQQEYIADKNNLLFLEKDYKRQKELFEGNAGTGKIFQEVESKYNAEKGNVASLENQLSMLSISTDALDKGEIIKSVALKAPIDGYMGHLNISLGAYAEPNKTLFDITDNSNLIVHLNIFEKDIIKVSKGQKVVVSLPNQNSVEIEGEIVGIGKSVDNETKTVSVRASIKDDKHIMIPGMFVNVFISMTELSSQIIPTEGVVRTGEKQYVFMATDEWCSNPNVKNEAAKVNTPIKEMTKDSVALTYKMVEVKTGPSANGYVGITPLEKISDCIVVVKGAYYIMSQLKSGQMVGCCEPEEGAKK